MALTPVIKVETLQPLTHELFVPHWRQFKQEEGREARDLYVALGGKACLGFSIAFSNGPNMTTERKKGVCFPMHMSNIGVGSAQLYRTDKQLVQGLQEEPERTQELSNYFGVGQPFHLGLGSILDVSFGPVEGDWRAVLEEATKSAALGVTIIEDVIENTTAQTVRWDNPLPAFIRRD